MAKQAIVIPLIILVVAVLFLVIDGKWTARSSSRAEQETDDAYVQADMTPLSTRISGTARTMKVNDFDSVKASQVLVEIDDDQYRAVVEEAKAALAASQAALEENQAAKRIQEAKIQTAEAMVAEAEAAVSTARAGISSTQPDVERTAIERKRQEALLAFLVHSAMLYSMNAMTSYGHVNLYLAPRWQMLGALEALNGWILFGLTTAFLFAIVQKAWSSPWRSKSNIEYLSGSRREYVYYVPAPD